MLFDFILFSGKLYHGTIILPMFHKMFHIIKREYYRVLQIYHSKFFILQETENLPPGNENLPPTKQRVCMKNKTPEKNMKNAIQKCQNQPKINPTATYDAIPLMPRKPSRQKNKRNPAANSNAIPPRPMQSCRRFQCYPPTIPILSHRRRCNSATAATDAIPPLPPPT